MEEIDNKAEKRKDADIMKKYKAVFSDIDGTLLNSKTYRYQKIQEKK